MAKRTPKFKPNLFDRVVGYFSPAAGLRRLGQRHMLNSFSATKPSRFKRDRDTSGGSGDDHLNQMTVWELREISRELMRNNGMVKGAVDRLVQNVLGPEGTALQARSDNETQNEEIERDWQGWLRNDADITTRWHGQLLFQKLKGGEYADGDHFVQLDEIGCNGNGSLRPFEADRVLTPIGVEEVNGFPMVNGIAFDPATGQPKWYFVANDHPLNGVCSHEDGKFIRAETVVPFVNQDRISQNRGKPILTPSFRDIDDLDDLIMYERIGAKLVAANGFVVKTDDPYLMAQSLLGSDSESGERIEEIEPGSVNYLKTNQDMVSVSSNRPGSNFEPFTRLIARMIGLPIGMPIELLLLDFSQINFSGSRQLLHLAQLGFRAEQFRTGCQLSKIYLWWLELQLARGKYNAADPSIRNHEWGFPGWPSPNPKEDALAFEIDLRAQTNSRSNYNRSKGRDWPKILSELKKEAEAIEDAGLKPEPPPSNNPPPASDSNEDPDKKQEKKEDDEDPQGGDK